MRRSERIVVTGSSGFVGRHLVQRLRSEGRTVVEVDLAEGMDISNWAMMSHVEPFDTAIHLAARSFTPDAFRSPRAYYETNVVGTLNVLELCRLFGSRMIYASTYVYGPAQYLPVDEEHPVHPTNPYTESKWIGERLCQRYHGDFGLPMVIFRAFNIYGPGQRSEFLIPTVIEQARGGEITLSDGSPRRDYVHVRDVVGAYVAALDSELAFGVFNLATGVSHSVKDVAEEVCQLSGREIPIRFLGKRRPDEVPDTRGDSSKAARVLGWSPSIGLTEGLTEMVRRS